jgi:hypothetical protein
MTRLLATLASCAFTPQRTFKPAACQWTNSKSVLASCDEMGTRSKSAPLTPITTAGRTFRLVRSVNGIGNKMTSFLEQVIEYVIGMVIPCFRQSLLGNSQPAGALGIGFNRHQNLRFIRQRQGLPQNQFTVFVESFDCRSHA